MLKDGKIWVANNDKGENIFILPKMANRHGLIAGATGTGKTITLKVMAESFSDMGVPLFMADVKGDVAGMMCPGVDTEDMQKRIQKFGLAEAGFEYKGCLVTLWDIFGQKGIPLRTTVSEIGPLLLGRILELNDLQTSILNIVFKIADDNQLLLIDTKDLKAMLNRPYDITMELLRITEGCSIYYDFHDRFILSNYYCVEASHKLAAFDKDVATARQTILPMTLFTESSLSGSSTPPLDAITQAATTLANFSKSLPSLSDHNSYCYAVNGQCMEKCIAIRNRLIK